MENWQQRARQFAEKHNLDHDPGVYALDCLSEFGEVAKELLKATGYGRPGKIRSPLAGKGSFGQRRMRVEDN